MMFGIVNWQKLTAQSYIGGGIVFVFFFVAIFGRLFAPYDPIELHLLQRLSEPSREFLLGTDEFGRDTLSRLLHGASTSAWIGFATLMLSIFCGTAIGTISGFFGGIADRSVMMLNDALLAFPGILLALGIVTIIGGGANGIILALALAYTPIVARVVRSNVISVRKLEYIDASRVMGNSDITTLVRHVLPNSVPSLIVLGTTMFGWIILSESALSFLGLGVVPPNPSWGNMLASARAYTEDSALLIFLPGFCIAITLLGINMLGDVLRDWLDPLEKD